MEIAKNILIGIYLIVALVVIVLTLMQAKEETGASATITGSSSNNFYEKNKARTKEGKMKRWTIILSILFAVLVIAVQIMYVL